MKLGCYSCSWAEYDRLPAQPLRKPNCFHTIMRPEIKLQEILRPVVNAPINWLKPVASGHFHGLQGRLYCPEEPNRAPSKKNVHHQRRMDTLHSPRPALQCEAPPTPTARLQQSTPQRGWAGCYLHPFSTATVFFFFFNLFLAALGLRCCAQVFSSCSAWASHCGGLPLQSTGSRHAGLSSCGTRASVVVAHRLSCSAACGIFPDQGSNLCPLPWQVDSQPLRHQGNPTVTVLP